MANTNDSQISLISVGTVIKGKIKSEEDLRVDGMVEGDIVTKTKVIVGTQGKINGEVVAHDVSISGEVDGSIKTSESVVLKNKCVINGNVTTNNLIVEPGAYVNGSISMSNGSSGNTVKNLKNKAPVSSNVKPATSKV